MPITGSTIAIRWQVRNPDTGALEDAAAGAMEVWIVAPSGTESHIKEPQIAKDALGEYHTYVLGDESGLWHYRIEVAGSGVDEGTFVMETEYGMRLTEKGGGSIVTSTPNVADRLNLSGEQILDVPTGTTAINVSSTDGTARIAGIWIGGEVPPDGYTLIVRQVVAWPPTGSGPLSPTEEEAVLRGLVKLQLNHVAAGKVAIVELGTAPDHVPGGSPLVAWLLTYVAAHNGWEMLAVA